MSVANTHHATPREEMTLEKLARILAILVGVAVVGYFALIVLVRLQKEGIWGLLGYETLVTVHSFVVTPPDGLIRSQVRESMDGENAVRVEIERLNDHKKTCQRMSVSDWNELYERLKNNIEPGTNKFEYYGHQGKEMEEPAK
jgi:hypothetical protein